MAVGGIATAIVMSVVYMQAEERRQMREREKVAIEAEVVDVVRGRGEHPRRDVTYRFEAGGRAYTAVAKLRERDRRTFIPGGRIPIEFVRSAPHVNWASGYEAEGFPLWMIPVLSISLLVIAASIIRGVRRQRMLLSEGRLAQARVTAHKKIQTDKRKGYRVSCEFQDFSGATRRAEYDAGKHPPPIGSVVPIIYHRDDPAWYAAYPLQFVRPAHARGRFHDFGGSGPSSIRRNSTSVPSA
jgi:hypothetical protein